MTVDLTTNIVTFQAAGLSTSIQLTSQEAEILFILNNRPVVNRDAVMYGVYGEGNWPMDKIVDVYICKLRKKLAGTALSITTIWGKGWRLELAA